jgi:hypothetical protein
MLFDTTESVHLQVVYIFIEAGCSTKQKTVIKAKLKFQLLFSQSKKINKTKFPTFKNGTTDR